MCRVLSSLCKQMCRPLLLMVGFAASFLIFVLGTAAVLSPVILMRIILLVLGFQVSCCCCCCCPLLPHERSCIPVTVEFVGLQP